MSTNKFDYYRIKDECRKGFLKYLARAVSFIAETNIYSILDIGCGTGVPSIWLAKHFNADITALDNDVEAIMWLEEKAGEEDLSDRINLSTGSFIDYDPGEKRFDLLVAEGFLNAVAFETGFLKVIRLIKAGGYFIIHDDLSDNEMKTEFFRTNGFALIHSFVMDEKAWWNDYYNCLEIAGSDPKNISLHAFFENDRKEIENYRLNPAIFRSAYYVLQKSVLSVHKTNRDNHSIVSNDTVMGIIKKYEA